MPGIFSWAHHSTYARTRRLQMPPFLARTDSNVSRVATAMANAPAPGDAVINMDPTAADKHDTLFGPNVGIMAAGPKWTESAAEKKLGPDELTPDIVKGWIDKAKEPVQPTTTLQALVNLKRPSLRLTPLQHEAGDAAGADQHALEFAYDCDAPKCAITVAAVHHGSGGRTPVFETVLEGGFGRALTLADGATLDLARFDTTPKLDSPSSDAALAPPAPPLAPAPIPVPSSAVDAQTPAHRRFAIPFRRRHPSVAGPAIAVLDADTHASSHGADDREARKDHEDEGGVRALITLVALDDAGVPIQPANAQATYLHVVRYGPHTGGDEEDTRPWVVKVVKREATIGPHTFHLHEIYGLSSAAAGSTATPTPTPTAPLPSSVTYPPTAAAAVAAAAAAAATQEDEPSSECLLCLSAPREVVLLPCRHLVACKECAINMVEFGAGGQITHTDDAPDATAASATTSTPATTAAETAASPDASSAPGSAPDTPETPAAPAPAGDASGADAQTPALATANATTATTTVTTVTPTTQPRRKRRAKGWFCPVCRQPYTSLLRITTVPPAHEDKDGKRVSTSTVDHPLTLSLPTLPATAAVRA